MSALLPIRSDAGALTPEASGAGARVRAPRTNLLLTGELILFGEAAPRPVRLRNLSISGAGIEMADPPAVGTTIILRRAAEETAAEVVWRSEDACGLRFTAPVELLRWIGERRKLARRPKEEEPSLTDDLAMVRQLLARLEDGLSDHPLLVAVLAGEMQAVDLAGQLLRAAEVRADGKAPDDVGSVRKSARALLAQRRKGQARA